MSECNHIWMKDEAIGPASWRCIDCDNITSDRDVVATLVIYKNDLQQQLDACKEAKEVMHQNMLTVVEAGAGIKQQLEKLEAENARLREALETIRDAGLEPIDPAYREYARAALGGDDG